jgi:membrane peptidoglycan carboxypeptidase
VANQKSDGGGTQGGSSLTQQYVKNVLLQDAVARNDKEGIRLATVSDGTEGYTRKLRELQYAIALEDRLTKPQILERYLNIAYFGQLAYGIEAASRRYFSKPASKLSLPEAALLAGIVRNPALYDPLRTGSSANSTAYYREEVLNRRNTVLARMAELRYITKAQHVKAKKAKVVTKPSRNPSGCANAKQAAFFCDFVERQFKANPAFGKTVKDREQLLRRGGITIRTSLNPGQQLAASTTGSSRRLTTAVCAMRRPARSPHATAPSAR